MDRTIRKFLHDQLAKEDSGIDPFPKEILEFYLANVTNVEDIVHFISGNPAPVWAWNPKEAKSQFPNLLGQYGLQRLIALDVLYRIERNEQAKAELAINAMIRLNQNLFGRPELLSQAAGFAILKIQLGLIRKVSWELSSVDLQILKQNYRKGYFDALYHDAIHSTFFILNDESLNKVLPKWYLNLIASDLAETNLKKIKVLESTEDCAALPDQYKSIHYARWNKFGDEDRGTYYWWQHYNEMLVDIDLTSRIIELKSYRQVNHDWPKSFPEKKDLRCPNAKFSLESTKDDQAVISITNVVKTREKETMLSRRWRISSSLN
jgi:hypothetical protein